MIQQNKNPIKNIGTFFIAHFFLFTLGMQLFKLTGMDLHIQQIMSICIFLSGIYYLTKFKHNSYFDSVIIVYILYMFFTTVLTNKIDYSMYFPRALYCHIFPVFCYFIGRNSQLSTEKVLSNMKWPILIAMICGIYFFFSMPEWYLRIKQEQLTSNNEIHMMKIFRLSSFWGHPYPIAYATLLYTIYLISHTVKGIIKTKHEKISTYILLGICIIVLLLAQLRVTLVIAVLSFLFLTYISKNSNKKTIFLLAIIISVFFVIYIFTTQLASSEFDFITNHIMEFFEEDALNNRFEHTAGGINGYSLFGDGVGYYGFLARENNRWAIVDQEFQCHLAELGYWGFSLLLIIIASTVVRIIKIYKNEKHSVDIMIFVFFTVAMLGASVLSNHHQYNYLFWFSLGHLWNYGKNNYCYSNI